MTTINKEHKHEYESRVEKVQVADRKYLGEGQYSTVILEKENHYIYCISCGDIKPVNIPSV